MIMYLVYEMKFVMILLPLGKTLLITRGPQMPIKITKCSAFFLNSSWTFVKSPDVRMYVFLVTEWMSIDAISLSMLKSSNVSQDSSSSQFWQVFPCLENFSYYLLKFSWFLKYISCISPETQNPLMSMNPEAQIEILKKATNYTLTIFFKHRIFNFRINNLWGY